jgi:uncharacterized protein YozE (UPF0346 family)
MTVSPESIPRTSIRGPTTPAAAPQEWAHQGCLDTAGGKATFVSWLASHVGEDSPIGDLARDAVADSQFPEGSSDERETYEEHLQTMGAADVAMNAFDDAWGRYVRVGA